MEDKPYAIAIIGAGAAGLATAIHCARDGHRVLLLDGRETIGAKILMSGGTRCNVTNQNVSEKDFASDRIRSVRNVLRAYPSAKTLHFFNGLGLELLVEEGGKYFPSTHSAQTILDALLSEIKNQSVLLKTHQKVTKITFKIPHFQIHTADSVFRSKTLALATGGLSYPNTGSDGSGYNLAKPFGHTLIPTIPALTPFKTDDDGLKTLSGISVLCKLTLHSEGKKQIAFEDPILFTHFGFSGPAVLNMSRHWMRARDKPQTEIRANFLPSILEDEFLNLLKAEREKKEGGSLKFFLKKWFAEKLIDLLLERSDIPENRIFNQLKKEERQSLIRHLYHFKLSVTDVHGYTKAEVTAGGIDLREVDTKDMQSKKQSGLFLVGEILDADGRIGGFNFQWAWATAFVAAEGIHKYLLPLDSAKLP